MVTFISGIKIKPRIVFETPEFNYEDRLKAITLVKK